MEILNGSGHVNNLVFTLRTSALISPKMKLAAKEFCSEGKVVGRLPSLVLAFACSGVLSTAVKLAKGVVVFALGSSSVGVLGSIESSASLSRDLPSEQSEGKGEVPKITNESSSAISSLQSFCY